MTIGSACAAVQQINLTGQCRTPVWHFIAGSGDVSDCAEDKISDDVAWMLCRSSRLAGNQLWIGFKLVCDRARVRAATKLWPQ